MENDSYIYVSDSDALLSALQDKSTYIVVTDDFRKEFEENVQMPLTETSEMGAQIGSAGGASLGGGLIFKIINTFSKGTDQQKEIDSRMRSYAAKETDNGEPLLYLRQLDY